MTADPRQLAALVAFEMQVGTEQPRHGSAEIFAMEEFLFRTRRPLSSRVLKRLGRIGGRRVA